MRYLISIFAPLSIIITLCTSCFDESYTPEQSQSFVSEMNELIDKVSVPLSNGDINDRFFSGGGPLSKAKYVLFGEVHMHDKTLLDQARALQTLVRAGDTVLFEGNDAGNIKPCDDYILGIFVATKTDDDLKYNKFAKSDGMNKYRSLFEQNKHRLNLNKLNIHYAKCGYWDNRSAFDVTPESQSLEIRNSTMADSMNDRKWDSNRTFVISGLLHLPSGDLDNFKQTFGTFEYQPLRSGFFPQLDLYDVKRLTLSEFYSVVDGVTHPKFRDLQEISAWGSTRKIYEFLKTIDYVEFMPKQFVDGFYSQNLATS